MILNSVPMCGSVKVNRESGGPAAWHAGAAAGRLPVVEPFRHAKYVETIPGTKVRFEMVPVPGGTYLMGSPPGEPGRSADEGPQHPVTIRPLWMGKMEVTWDEYDLYRKEKAVEEPRQNEER